MLNFDHKYMHEALKEAQKAFDKGEVPIGAVIVAGGVIIARSHNLTETLCDVTAHAEMLSITAAASKIGGKYLKDATIYVTIEPCPMCAAALYHAQIGGIVYGARDVKRGYSVISEKLTHPKTVVKSGVLESECRELIQLFFKARR